MKSIKVNELQADDSPGNNSGDCNTERGQWKHKIDFLFACIGFSVGFGNVWRFPYFCFKNGGGAFLIPYFISVIFAGIPMFFLEVSIGQLMRRGGIEAWEILPLFKGVGYGGVFILFCLNCYYNVILAWILFYLFASMSSSLPWNTCDGYWNTDKCIIVGNNTKGLNRSGFTDSVNEYWEHRVLGISEGIEDVGQIRWELALCLLLAWIIVFVCIYKGIRASGYVVYVTASMPFILMIILLIRTVTLEGSWNGLKMYLTPNFSKINNFEVWSDAGTQVFFSYSVGIGTLTALGSFNNFNHNTIRDTGLFALLNTFTSLLAGCIIFSTLGFMSNTSGIPLDAVAEPGPGLAFVAYPKALSTMWCSPLWSVLFFLMLLLLGLDSQFIGVDGFITGLVDMFPNIFNNRKNRILLTFVSCCLMFFVGLLMVTNGGVYVFQIFDYYVGSRIVLMVVFCECLVIAYAFGARRFGKFLKFMYSKNITMFSIILYCVTVPIFSLTLFVMSVIAYDKLVYKRATTTYKYPEYSVVLGWCLASCSLLCIPLVAIFRLLMQKGTFVNRFRKLMEPNFTEECLRNIAAIDNLSDSTLSQHQ